MVAHAQTLGFGGQTLFGPICPWVESHPNQGGETMTANMAWLVGLFFSCAFAMPIPEDVALFSAGLLVSKGTLPTPLVFLVAWSAIVIGDSTSFLIGQVFGVRVFEFKWARRIVTSEKREAIEGRLRRWGPYACFAARFIPGARIPMYVIAGVSGVRPFLFLGLNSLAAAVSVSFWLFVGHHLSRLAEVRSPDRSQTITSIPCEQPNG